jgi:hypothetical protein
MDISSAYYVDSKLIRFVKLRFTHKRLRNCENLPNVGKREETLKH